MSTSLKYFSVVAWHDDTTCFFYGGGDAACLVTFLPVVARVVEYRYLFGSSFETFLYEGLYQFRIGITGQFRCTVPADIGLNNDFLPFFDIFADAAKRF